MKPFLLKLLLIFSSFQAFAQPVPILEQTFSSLQHLHFSNTGKDEINKTTGLQQRLKSIRFYDNTEVWDSVRFTYAHGRGSSFNFNTMNFNWEDVEAPDVNMDSALRFSISPWGSSSLYKITARTYDQTGKLVSSMDTAQSLVGRAKDFLLYDTAGRLIDLYHLVRQTWDWDTSQHKHYEYINIPNGLVRIQTDLPNRVTDTMDLSGKLVMRTKDIQDPSGNFHWSSTSAYYYNALGQLEKILTHNPNSIYLDTLIYTASPDMWSEWIGSRSSGGPFEPENRATRHFNSQNLPDSLTQYTFNSGIGWALQYYFWWSYNAQGNPTSYYSLNPTPGAPVDSISYYYEDYDPLAIAETSRPLLFDVYPNPAEKELYVDIPDGDKPARIDLKVYNMEGRLVLMENLDNDHSKISIPVVQLTPGVYIIELSRGNGTNGRKIFIKH